MKVLSRRHTLCLSCMEEHEVLTVEVDEAVHMSGDAGLVRYKAVYDHCTNTDEFWADEKMLQQNHFSMLDARIAATKED